MVDKLNININIHLFCILILVLAPGTILKFIFGEIMVNVTNLLVVS